MHWEEIGQHPNLRGQWVIARPLKSSKNLKTAKKIRAQGQKAQNFGMTELECGFYKHTRKIGLQSTLAESQNLPHEGMEVAPPWSRIH